MALKHLLIEKPNPQISRYFWQYFVVPRLIDQFAEADDLEEPHTKADCAHFSITVCSVCEAGPDSRGLEWR